jgi:competence protein ComEA
MASGTGKVCLSFATESSPRRTTFAATLGGVPEIQLTRRQILVGAVVVVALVLVGAKLLARPQAAASPPIPTATRPEPAVVASMYVDVVGAVRRPGLYRLPRGARVADALARAGGPTRKAQLELVNLAAPIADGEQVVVPRRGTGGAVAGAGGAVGAATGPVHLNTATLEQLDALPGIGPVTAQKILDYRQQHGAFSSVDELDAVPGIGPAKLDQLKGLVAP